MGNSQLIDSKGPRCKQKWHYCRGMRKLVKGDRSKIRVKAALNAVKGQIRVCADFPKPDYSTEDLGCKKMQVAGLGQLPSVPSSARNRGEAPIEPSIPPNRLRDIRAIALI